MCKYLIHYFSGTGNTSHMAKIIQHELKNRGYSAELLNIENDSDININDYEMHVFCFPIYGFGTPSIMLKYISNINLNTKSQASIICTSAGFEGQALSHFKQLLKQKGFKVIFTDMVIYTYNWTQVLNPQTKETEERVFKEADSKVIKLVDKIISCETSFKKRNILSLVLSWIVFTIFSKLARRILGKTFIADSSCINCGKCENICPAKAINIYNGRPRWNWKCETCQRCINMCPKKSIQLSIVKLLIFLVLELIPVWIIMNVNIYVVSLSTISNISLYLIMFFINNMIAGIIIDAMEKVRVFRKILEISYTKKYRRNVASDFQIK